MKLPFLTSVVTSVLASVLTSVPTSVPKPALNRFLKSVADTVLRPVLTSVLGPKVGMSCVVLGVAIVLAFASGATAAEDPARESIAGGVPSANDASSASGVLSANDVPIAIDVSNSDDVPIALDVSNSGDVSNSRFVELASPDGDGSDAAAAVARPILFGEGVEDQPTYDVEIHDDYFQPQIITITVGAIVRWTNAGAHVHSTTSDDNHWTATLPPGGEFSVRFLSPGAFGYHCDYHSGVGAHAWVVVTSQPGPTPSATPATAVPSPTWIAPTPSPGGGEIVFDYFANESLRDKTDLFVVQPDGTGRLPITSTSDRAEAQPSWAPGYGQVAYTTSRVDRQSDPWQLAVLDRQTGQSRMITAGPEHYEPDWSPDGSRIAYTAMTRVGSVVARSEIATVRPDGTGQRTLIRMDSTAYALINPTWSPDGRMIAFTVGSDYTGGELYVMDADGRNARRLFSHPGYDDIDPAWSPDGRYISFASGAMRGSVTNVVHSIWLLDINSGTAGTIAHVPTWDLRRPAWSTDGTEIVFNAEFESTPVKRWALYIVPALGGTVRGPVSVGVEPDWGSESLLLPTPGPLPTMTPTQVVPPTPPVFPTLPTPLPTVPGPSPTIPPPPTFPPPTLEPTPTSLPSSTATATSLPATVTPTPTMPSPQSVIHLPIAHKPEQPAN